MLQQAGFGTTMIALAMWAATQYAAAPPCTASVTAALAAMVTIALAVGIRDVRRVVNRVTSTLEA
jgi:hypothetical protein